MGWWTIFFRVRKDGLRRGSGICSQGRNTRVMCRGGRVNWREGKATRVFMEVLMDRKRFLDVDRSSIYKVDKVEC